MEFVYSRDSTMTLGMFAWNELRYKKVKILSDIDTFDVVEMIYDPQDVQDLIDEHGLSDAVLYINRECLIKSNRYGLELNMEGGNYYLSLPVR